MFSLHICAESNIFEEETADSRFPPLKKVADCVFSLFFNKKYQNAKKTKMEIFFKPVN